jgi:hypothetical protein
MIVVSTGDLDRLLHGLLQLQFCTARRPIVQQQKKQQTAAMTECLNEVQSVQGKA